MFLFTLLTPKTPVLKRMNLHIKLYRCLNWAFDFDTVSMKFRNMKIKSAFLIAYDIFTEGMSPDIDVRFIL